jgi:hypothetical protein
MEKDIKDSLDEISELITNNGYFTEIKKENNRITLVTNETMRDPGLSSGNTILDLFFEESTKTVFIGMLRLPKKIRGKKLSNHIVGILKKTTCKNNYQVFVDACDECDIFWKKQGFTHIHSDSLGFDILGYSAEEETIKIKWENFKKTDVFRKNLFMHQ